MAEEILSDPTNRVVALFDEGLAATEAKQQLVELGQRNEDVQVLIGRDLAEQIDASPKWFADTDDELRMYKNKLKVGYAVLTTPIQDSASRTRVHDVLKACGAEHVTHFGQWVTEVMR